MKYAWLIVVVLSLGLQANPDEEPTRGQKAAIWALKLTTAIGVAGLGLSENHNPALMRTLTLILLGGYAYDMLLAEKSSWWREVTLLLATFGVFWRLSIEQRSSKTGL